jgi:hypothetical protein
VFSNAVSLGFYAEHLARSSSLSYLYLHVSSSNLLRFTLPIRESATFMKWIPWLLAAVLPVLAVGWAGAFVGHFAVAAVTVGIFVSTLSLGRAPAKALVRDSDAIHLNT